MKFLEDNNTAIQGPEGWSQAMIFGMVDRSIKLEKELRSKMLEIRGQIKLLDNRLNELAADSTRHGTNISLESPDQPDKKSPQPPEAPEDEGLSLSLEESSADVGSTTIEPTEPKPDSPKQTPHPGHLFGSQG